MNVRQWLLIPVFLSLWWHFWGPIQGTVFVMIRVQTKCQNSWNFTFIVRTYAKLSDFRTTYIVNLISFFSLMKHRDTNSFQRLFSNGTNAYLIDRTRPTTVFVHGFSDSFKPKRNSKCSFALKNWSLKKLFWSKGCEINEMYRGRNFHFQTEYCSLKDITLNNESYLVFANWQNLNFLLADYFKDMIYNQNRFGN